MSSSIVSRTRLAAAVNSSSYELLKDVVVVYLVVTRSLKVFRHLRARGIAQTAVDFWQWLSRVSDLTIGALYEQQIGRGPVHAPGCLFERASTLSGILAYVSTEGETSKYASCAVLVTVKRR